MGKGKIGVYGLGVMGRNLALNLEEHGYRVSLYNRTVPGEENVVPAFLQQDGKNKDFIGTQSPEAFIDSLESPRKVLLMVKAGDAVDKVIDQLAPLLSPGDILIDGGNSHFKDTVRRVRKLHEMKLRFVGMGVSGGEVGARRGPSLMPGGSKTAWKSLKPILQNIAATDPEGKPCCNWIGTDGAGHFVKMVHNGIEYADMQLIAECYHVMKDVLKMPLREIGTVFERWNSGELNSYLLEITAEILKATTDEGEPLVDKILDSAGQKGTGLWTSVTALESGTPLPTITSAVFARVFSSFKELRNKLSQKLGGPALQPVAGGEASRLVTALQKALTAGRIITLAEGFFFIEQISEEKNWGIDPAEVARIWQNGCIIRAELLKPVKTALQTESVSTHLLETKIFSKKLPDLIPELRNVVATGIRYGIPVPAMSTVLAQYDMLRSERLPANLIQAQRDYFGAHTYERVDRPRGEYFHTDWYHINDKP